MAGENRFHSPYRQFLNRMESKWDKDYPLLEALSEAELDDNSSLKKMLQLVGNDR
jgi:hypothetical protein